MPLLDIFFRFTAKFDMELAASVCYEDGDHPLDLSIKKKQGISRQTDTDFHFSKRGKEDHHRPTTSNSRQSNDQHGKKPFKCDKPFKGRSQANDAGPKRRVGRPSLDLTPDARRALKNQQNQKYYAKKRSRHQIMQDISVKHRQMEKNVQQSAALFKELKIVQRDDEVRRMDGVMFTNPPRQRELFKRHPKHYTEHKFQHYGPFSEQDERHLASVNMAKPKAYKRPDEAVNTEEHYIRKKCKAFIKQQCRLNEGGFMNAVNMERLSLVASPRKAAEVHISPVADQQVEGGAISEDEEAVDLKALFGNYQDPSTEYDGSCKAVKGSHAGTPMCISPINREVEEDVGESTVIGPITEAALVHREDGKERDLLATACAAADISSFFHSIYKPITEDISSAEDDENASNGLHPKIYED